MIVHAQQGETLDQLVWRHYGQTEGVVEMVLAANPGLAQLGPVLPHGHPVTLPDLAPPPAKRLVQLWD
ncbi:MAG: tail protein X [Gammaproteobacteria bacterium]|nr:tail protein X [Gammaproteobacteria bacterium]